MSGGEGRESGKHSFAEFRGGGGRDEDAGHHPPPC